MTIQAMMSSKPKMPVPANGGAALCSVGLLCLGEIFVDVGLGHFLIVDEGLQTRFRELQGIRFHAASQLRAADDHVVAKGNVVGLARNFHGLAHGKCFNMQGSQNDSGSGSPHQHS
jgi:hypothetical protein